MAGGDMTIYNVPFTVDGIAANLYVVQSSGEFILIDTGYADTPYQVLFPYLRRSNLALESLKMVVNTHAHADHSGGNAVIKGQLGVPIAAHESEQAWIRNPRLQYAELLAPWASLTSMEEADFLQRAGRGVEVDVSLDEKAELGVGTLTLRVIHTPGHSEGHIGVWIPERGVLVSGDAVLGSGITLQDDVRIAPMMTEVGKYLNSIERIRQLSPEALLTCHHGIVRDRYVPSFLQASSDTVLRMIEAVKEIVRQEGPRCVAELVHALARKLHYNLDIQLYVSAQALLKHLE